MANCIRDICYMRKKHFWFFIQLTGRSCWCSVSLVDINCWMIFYRKATMWSLAVVFPVSVIELGHIEFYIEFNSWCVPEINCYFKFDVNISAWVHEKLYMHPKYISTSTSKEATMETNSHCLVRYSARFERHSRLTQSKLSSQIDLVLTILDGKAKLQSRSSIAHIHIHGCCMHTSQCTCRAR